MPGYHLVAGGRTMLNGNMMELLSTMRPKRMAVYQWDNPLAAFLWPMNSMTRLEEEKDFDYEQLETYLAQSDCYWICRIYKSHSGLLDAYLRFKGEDRVTRYILDFDAVDVSDTWPQPSDFYLARRAIRTQESMQLQAYNASEIWAPMPRAVPWAPMTPPTATAIPPMPAAIQAVPPTRAAIELVCALALEPPTIRAAAIEAVPAAMGETAIPEAPMATCDDADEAALPVTMDKEAINEAMSDA